MNRWIKFYTETDKTFIIIIKFKHEYQIYINSFKDTFSNILSKFTSMGGSI